MPPTHHWKLGSTYRPGDVVVYQGQQYVCLQQHTVHDQNWNPLSAAALFSFVAPATPPGIEPSHVPVAPATSSALLPVAEHAPPPPPSSRPSGNLAQRLCGKRLVVGYYQSWSAPYANVGAMHELALLRSKGYTYNVICLAFAKPDANYVRESFVDTGLEFNSDFAVVRDAIAMLKQQSSSSSTVVLLSVGGATYRNWNNLDVKSLHALVDDLGADGIDIDLEDQTMRHELGGIISRLRNEFPTGEYFLSLAAFSVGAYGHGEYQDAPPASPNTGMCVPGLQQSGAMLDAIFGMFYDASNAFDPCVAFQAYRQLFHHGPIAMGVEVPPEAWGGHTVTIHKIESYAHHVLREDPNGLSGLMVWSHHKAGYPSARDVVDVALRHFS